MEGRSLPNSISTGCFFPGSHLLTCSNIVFSCVFVVRSGNKSAILIRDALFKLHTQMADLVHRKCADILKKSKSLICFGITQCIGSELLSGLSNERTRHPPSVWEMPQRSSSCVQSVFWLYIRIDRDEL